MKPPMSTIGSYFDCENEIWKRFTDRARLVMAVADQFALEQRVNEIRPEHILRALASVDCGVGRAVLDGLNIDLFKLLPEIVELLPAGSGAHPLNRDFGKAGRALLAATHRAASELAHNYI